MTEPERLTRLLLDQDIYHQTAVFLRSLNYDLIRVGELKRLYRSDSDMLRLAQHHRRVFVTRDKDFWNIHDPEMAVSGIIYLHFNTIQLREGHQELARVLETYQQASLLNAFIVVEATRYRFREFPH